MAEFKTIRQTAATGIWPESGIRRMVAEGTCPGIKTGNRFMVKVSAGRTRLQGRGDPYLAGVQPAACGTAEPA